MSRSTVVFDLGGVLLHWQPLSLLQQVLPQHAPDEAAARNLAGQIFQGFEIGSDWSLFDLGQIEPAALSQRIARRTGLAADQVKAVIDAIPPHLATLDETVDLMHLLRAQDHRLCFLSNMPATYAAHLVAHKDFFGAFDDGIFSADVHCIKPERAIYELAVERFGLQDQQTWFIDDVQRNLDAASALGWQGIRFESPAQVRLQLLNAGLLIG